MTGEEISVYPFISRFCKMSGSFGIMLFMVRISTLFVLKLCLPLLLSSRLHSSVSYLHVVL